MKKKCFYKKIKCGGNRKIFLFGILFSHKKKTLNGYVDSLLFGLWKAKKENHTIRYYFAGLYVWKRNTNKEDSIREGIKQIEQLSLEIKQFYARSNLNVINLFLSEDNDDENLFYIQTPNVLFVFSKQILKGDKSFIENFLFKTAFRNEFIDFRIMPKTCRLYREHIDGFRKKHVLICKYAKRRGVIYKSTVTHSVAGNDLFIAGTYLGLENYQTYRGLKYSDTPKRKILQGNTLGDYLKDKTDNEKKEILKSFFDWLFSEYQSEEDDMKLKGIVVDCHSDNFLISDGKFVFIDMDITLETDFPKNSALWGVLRDMPSLYAYFSKLYGLPRLNPPHPLWENGKFVTFNNENLEKAAVLNKKLLDKYFSEKDLIPEY